MISLSGINKRFGRLQVLDNINLHFKEGQSTALIGPNGSGKTTLIKCLLGMVIPDGGTIRWNERDILRDWTARAEMGYMPQMARYPDNMTIAQLFDMMKDIRRNAGGGFDEELFHAFRLDRMLGKRMRTLSGGTRQKVSACLAFLFNPSILILDEPTAGLDPVSSGLLQEKVHEEARKGKLILITSHILSELDGLVNEIVYLQEGKVKFHKSLRELQKDTGEEKLARAVAHVMQNT